ncbi:MAG: hypothetical protein P1V81_16825 [Planctomycetota bacterium]|nr:hypothetical protein [Planctomycetota bacterium]
MTRCFPKAFLAIVALAASAPVTFAQSDLQVEADIEFAQGLARRWQFVDLAEGVLEELSKGSLDGAQSERLGLVRCEIYATAAKRERNAEERDRLFGAALTAYQDFIADNEFSDLKPAAESAYVQLSNTFAGVLELALADQVGEEAEATRTRIRETLEEPLSRTGALIASLKSIDEPTALQERELYALMLDRGKMLSTLGRASEDGTFYLGQAETTLDELALTAGERSAWGLQANIELARVLGATGDWAYSMDLLEFVLDTVMPRDKAILEPYFADLSPADLELHWYYAEMATPPLLEACVSANKPEAAISWALHYFNIYKKYGFSLSKPRGHMALLASASVLMDAGGYVGGRTNDGELQWYATKEDLDAAESSRRNKRTAVDLALSMAQTTNEENRGNVLQTRAQKLISEIIERPGIAIGPEILFEAAQGHYREKDYPAAIEGMKRVLAALEDEDEAARIEFGPKVLNHIGLALGNQKRYLESAMVFREAVTVWKGDPQFDSKNANGMLSAVKALQAGSTADPQIEQLFQDAQRFVVETAGAQGAGEVVFNQAMREYEDGEYDIAFEKFGEVDTGADSYEKALVYKGACRYKQQRYDEATELFNAYLVDYLGDPTNVTDLESRLARRQEASALATFYLGNITYKQKDYAGTISHLGTFHEDFPGQSQMAPNAIYMALISSLNTGEIANAERLHGVMVEDFADNRFTGIAAKRLYSAIAPTGKDEPSAPVLRKMAELMAIANSLSSSPAYSDLRRESGHWIDLGEWETAEATLRKTSKAFANSTDPDERKGWHRNVQPDLALVLLEQGKLPEALDVVRPLIPPVKTPEGEPDPEFRPTAATVDTFCKAAVGWVEGEKVRDMVEVLGVGTPEDVALAADWRNNLANSKNKFTLEWYELKFETIFTWRRMGQDDTAKLESAKSQISTMKQDVGNDFIGVFEDFEKAGLDGGPLQQKFQWLSRSLS